MELDVLGALLPIFLVVFDIALILWTYKDARRRLDDEILVATAVLAAIAIPVIGIFIYMLLRPAETIAEIRERELEMRAMERAIGRRERCPRCKSSIEADYLACPLCTQKLRQSCRRCEKPLDPRWKVCPFCETEAPVIGKARPKDADAETSRSGEGARQPRAKAEATAEKAKKADGVSDDLTTEPLTPSNRK